MSTIPARIKNYVAYMDAVGYAGKVPEGKLPAIKIKTDTYDGGGLAAEIDLDMGGIEKMELELTFAEYIPAVLGLFGNPDASVTLRGAQEDAPNTAEAVIISVRGLFSQVDPGSWKKNSQTASKCTVSATYFKYSIGAATVMEIDALNMKRIINGTDQLAAIRRAIGL